MNDLVIDYATRLKRTKAQPIPTPERLLTFFREVSAMNEVERQELVSSLFEKKSAARAAKARHPLERDLYRAHELHGGKIKPFIAALAKAVVEEFPSAAPLPAKKETKPGFFAHFSDLPQNALREFIIKFGLDNATKRY